MSMDRDMGKGVQGMHRVGGIGGMRRWEGLAERAVEAEAEVEVMDI